jgi:PIN domain
VSVARPIALLDANVLYPATLRDLLLWLAVNETYRAHWTAQIHEEWMQNLLEHQPHLSRDQLQRTRSLMESALPNALVTGYESHMPRLVLPDVNDRHVLAAAIQAGADWVLTMNLRDFPASVLEPHEISAIHPDTFACLLSERNPVGVLRSVAAQRANFKNPPLTRDQYLERLHQQGLSAFCAWFSLNMPE